LSDLLALSACELAALVRRGQASARELVDAHIARIEQVNPTLNAVVAERFEEARADADEWDWRRAQRGTLPDFAGVPFTVKELIDTVGMPSTFGSSTRRGRRAAADATVVRRLRRAGAIPIASTNIPEWGLWFETDNLVYGRTNNPHNLAHTTGGSSGGEAAVVAAGGAAFGVGSDIGGSIRIPAAFCGVFGHKPTNGLVPLTGHYPVYATGPDANLHKNNPWVVIGPIARKAVDLWPLLNVMAGDDGVDPNIESITLTETMVDWRGRIVWVLEDPHIKWAGSPRPDVAAAVRQAAKALSECGADVREFDTTLFRDAVDLWFSALQSIGSPMLKELVAESGSISVTAELMRTIARRPRFTLPVLGFCLVEGFTRKSAQKLARAEKSIQNLQLRFDRMMENDAVLLMPPHPRPAPRHYRPLFHPFSFSYTAVMNVLRVPATVVPAGTDAHGLPLAVQIAARRGGDHLTIAAARLLEEVFGGSVTPPVHALLQ
jgi:fatty acid amide hydrolase 2